MKARIHRTCFAQLVLLLLLTQHASAQSYGRVVINEYMPWTSNTCGTTTEFIELMNFGPGPVDIGCHIITTGVYSITIPPNTILKPGDYYVLAGKSFLPNTCANADSTATGITANLNWNTCNCTNTTIPSSNASEGLMRDDGYSPIVLMDPAKRVIDAVVRGLPAAATVPVTTSSLSGGCTSRTFNLDTMGINYEVLGMAPGNQNSFARLQDGDCNWKKQPQSTGNAPNKPGSSTTDITYQFDMVNPTVCGEEQGSVSIFVKHSDYGSIFPMTYTIVLDTNKDGLFDFNDEYRTDTVYDPPFIEINDLPIGKFKVTVASVKGCYLKTFPFDIFSCNPGTLPVELVYFKNKNSNGNAHELEWLLQDVKNLQGVVVEKGNEAGIFVPSKIITNEQNRGNKVFSMQVSATAEYQYYRLKITQKNGKPFYSQVINLNAGKVSGALRIWPNPATTQLHIEVNNPANRRLTYNIYNNSGIAVGKGILPGSQGQNAATIPVQALAPGVYQLQVTDLTGSQQPIPFRFVKQ